MSDESTPKGVLMVSFRDYTLRTLFGSCNFKADEPRMLSPRMAEEALAVGIVPVDKDSEILKPTAEPKEIPSSPQARKAAINKALKIMHARAGTKEGREDWTAARRPKVSVVSGILGFKVHADEINRIISEANEKKDAAELEEMRKKASGKKPRAKKEVIDGGEDFGE